MRLIDFIVEYAEAVEQEKENQERIKQKMPYKSRGKKR